MPKTKYRLSDECERTWSRAKKYKWRKRLAQMEEKLKHPKRHSVRVRKSGDKAKLEVLTHYGPEGRLGCCWEGCTITDIDMLTLDHVNDDGYIDRALRGVRGGGKAAYFRFRKQGFPEGLQTLCANHNTKKEVMRREKKFKLPTQSELVPPRRRPKRTDFMTYEEQYAAQQETNERLDEWERVNVRENPRFAPLFNAMFQAANDPLLTADRASEKE